MYGYYTMLAMIYEFIEVCEKQIFLIGSCTRRIQKVRVVWSHLLQEAFNGDFSLLLLKFSR